jgi:hypothetical protein
MNKSGLTKATSEQIKERLRKFIGSSGGGQWSFQLECRLCRDLGIVSAKAHSIQSDKNLSKAAKKFESQGWWFYEGELICPKCYKRKLPKD